ncbi:MAG: hypothetical protein EF813_12275 [Methanosarcinales archaeon]|nr:MAG: hypothetical protein EF813_12275 [Methanosarcinales archaeon]
MQDVTYIELIILEYRDETELADAKHDSRINMQDVHDAPLTSTTNTLKEEATRKTVSPPSAYGKT